MLKYLNEFRDPQTAQQLISRITQALHSQKRRYRIMEFCGGHTHAIYRYGLYQLLPPELELLHGPGCPVCVLPAEKVSEAIRLAREPDVILCTYGDLLRVPDNSNQTLFSARASGADVRMVYSSLDALAIAHKNPHKKVIFFAIGFETTAPATAVALEEAIHTNTQNFFIHCNHVLTPAAIQALFAQGTQIDAIIGPGHVSTVVGAAAYETFVQRYKIPVVISGFETIDILQSIYVLVCALNENQYGVWNEYNRSVQREGNLQAKQLMEQYFELRSTFGWRGLGEIPDSAFKLKSTYAAWDAEHVFAEVLEAHRQNNTSFQATGCICDAILRGTQKPSDCALFGTTCTPENPVGACMVSSEGTCSAWYMYRNSPKILQNS